MEPHPYVTFCEQAECSLDSPLTDQELADRWCKRTGGGVSVEYVRDLRKAWVAYINSQPGHVRTIRLPL